jgi:hypothetical protein
VTKLLVVGLGVIAAGSLVGNWLLFQRYSTTRPILKMDGGAVSIKEYRDSLEYQFGKLVLTKMTMGKIVLNAAKKAGVAPTDKEVDARLADIQRRNPKQLEEARKDAIKMAELRRDLTTDIALENLTMKDVKLSEAEIRAFYNKNQSLFSVPTQSQTLIVLAQNSVDAATAASLMKQPNMTPAAIASTQPRLGVVGVNVNPKWEELPASARARLANAVMTTPVGAVAKVPIENVTFVFRVDKRTGSGLVPYEKVHATAERMARLAKAPPREAVVARLYKDANVRFEIPRYAGYFDDIDAISQNPDLSQKAK